MFGRMAAIETFREWLADVRADEVVIDPFDINVEARGNLWTFGPLTGADLSAWRGFADGVVAAREGRLRSAGERVGAMKFYCWHDQQAGQLRVSLVSSSHGRLPFGAETVEAKLESVIQSLLGPPHEPYVPLQVWSVALPRE